VHIPQDSLCGFNNACSFWQCRIPGGCFNLAQQGPQECDGNICTNDSCINYGCVTLSANTNPCNDNNPCTNNDRCTVTSHGAECVGTAFCDDGNVCTADTCNASTLECSYTNRTGSCNDGNPCNGVDTCVSGTCQSGTATCDDGKSCTTDACTQFGCTHTAEGCDDGNPCTFDGCDATEACYHLDQPVSCDDGNPCTSTDTCNAGVCSGTPLNCNDGNACTADSCTGTGCAHQPVTGGQVTCGVGACQRTVDACVNGVPQTCVPGTPSPEACNGLDDDCDGSVDEGCALTVSCVPNPATLSLSSQGGMILINCQFPISGSAATQVYVSRLDSADTSSDDVVLPDPSTLPCPDPVLGTLYERGISENMAIRGVLDPSVAFKFNLPSDGDCSTLDGNRQDFAARLAAIPNNTNATVCISGTLDGQNFEACMLMKVLNTGPR
jgi:hypothetical protein